MLKLSVADLCIQIVTMDAPFLTELKQKYTAFLSEDDPVLVLYLKHEDLLISSDEIKVNKNGQTYTIDGGEFNGVLDLKTGIVKGVLRPERSVFDSFLRVVVAIVLPNHGGFLVHSAGLVKEGRGFLFAGASESGKSTTARSAQGLEVLNDELTALRKRDGTFFIYSTPFHGDYDVPVQNQGVELDTIFFLNKSIAEFNPVARLKVLIQLMENIFFFDPDPEINQVILNLAQSAADVIDGYEINIQAREHLGGFIDEIRKNYART